jgi:NAD+ kinase
LPIEFELEFSIGDNEGGVLIVDGQEIYNISIEDRLKVKISQKRAKLIHKIERDYFGVLREKLLWGK